MGQTQAKNEVKSAISAMSSVVNDVVQKCSPTVAISQVINAVQEGCDTSTIDISNIDFSSFGQINVSCAQTAASSASVQTDIQQKASQMAEAVSQSLNLNPGSTSAQNIMRLSMNVATSITNSTSQIIASAVSSAQQIDLRQNGKSVCSIKLAYINMNAIAKSVADAVQNSTQVANATTALTQVIDQSAKAKQSSMALMIILVIIVVLGLGGSQVMKPALYVGVPVVGGLFAWRLWLDHKYAQADSKETFTGCAACGVV